MPCGLYTLVWETYTCQLCMYVTIYAYVYLLQNQLMQQIEQLNSELLEIVGLSFV